MIMRRPNILYSADPVDLGAQSDLIGALKLLSTAVSALLLSSLFSS
jgi:hypothetical protein